MSSQVASRQGQTAMGWPLMSGPMVDWAPGRAPKGSLDVYTVLLGPQDVLAIEKALGLFYGMSSLP